MGDAGNVALDMMKSHPQSMEEFDGFPAPDQKRCMVGNKRWAAVRVRTVAGQYFRHFSDSHACTKESDPTLWAGREPC